MIGDIQNEPTTCYMVTRQSETVRTWNCFISLLVALDLQESSWIENRMKRPERSAPYISISDLNCWNKLETKINLGVKMSDSPQWLASTEHVHPVETWRRNRKPQKRIVLAEMKIWNRLRSRLCLSLRAWLRRKSLPIRNGSHYQCQAHNYPFLELIDYNRYDGH